MVTISMSSLLAVRGATEAFCSFVAGGASWPATASRLVRSVDLRVCVKSIICRIKFRISESLSRSDDHDS